MYPIKVIVTTKKKAVEDSQHIFFIIVDIWLFITQCRQVWDKAACHKEKQPNYHKEVTNLLTNQCTTVSLFSLLCYGLALIGTPRGWWQNWHATVPYLKVLFKAFDNGNAYHTIPSQLILIAWWNQGWRYCFISLAGILTYRVNYLHRMWVRSTTD